MWLQVGTSAMDSPLLKYSAKDYFFKAALCHFCIDMLNAKVSPTSQAAFPGCHCLLAVLSVRGQFIYLAPILWLGWKIVWMLF